MHGSPHIQAGVRSQGIGIDRMPGSGWVLWIEGARGVIRTDAFQGLDGLLYGYQCVNACLAADAGKVVDAPRAPAEKETPFQELSLTHSAVVDAYLLQMQINGLKFEGWFKDLPGLRMALTDASVFYAYRAGRMTLKAANTMSSRPLAANPN